jgi:ABC-2 type transport system ATP-binding protein
LIRLDNLQKSFGGRPALHGLSLEVQAGEIFGLLGHNGAGKSTAFGIMLGQVYADAGEVWLNGISVQQDRARALTEVGAIFEAPAFYDYLSGWQNLEIFSAYTAHVPRSAIEAAVQTVDLSARIHHSVGTYSHGMRQRLALAQALLPEPRLVLLDEPTEGLDPEGIHEIRALIQRLNRERRLTVFFSSHLLSEVEQLCHRVAILNQGRLVFCGPWTELQNDGQSYRITVDDWPRAAEIAQRLGAAIMAPGEIELALGADVAPLVTAFVEAGLAVRAVEPRRRSLETLYLELVGERSQGGNPIEP